TQVQPGSLRPCPGAVSPVVPRRLARGRLESSFSVEAILARPKTRELAATSLPLSTCTSLNLLGAVSQYGVLPWVCSTGSWLPAYLSVGVYPLCSMSCVPGLNVTHHQQGLRLTGEDLVPKSQGEVSEAAKTEIAFLLCHGGALQQLRWQHPE
ncbi:mCG1036528, partial [Mus musculus]